MSEEVLVTTAIDYVNDVIHIGHAYQKILADALARYYRQTGHQTFFLTGTDEHGSKTEAKAKELGISPQRLADKISAQDKKQLDSLNLSYDRFIRTTDKDHKKVVQDFYMKIYNNGDIYKGEYKGLYCESCEAFYTEKDLTDEGCCPYHPTKEIKELTEKNYFFRWSKYEDFLRDKIENDPGFLIPEMRRNEMLALLERGLKDKAFTRPKTSVKFGIEVPHDKNHVIYVWSDALVNYVTGKPEFWQDPEAKIIHILGKDNVTFHALLWPAMLKSAGYRLPNTIYGHDFFTLNGQRISKSLGNIIRPLELVKDYGADATRYFFLRYGPLRHDVDVSRERITEVYNSDLANSLGNLVARVAVMAKGERFELGSPAETAARFYTNWVDRTENLRIDLALQEIWQEISRLDSYIEDNRVWEAEGQKRMKHLRQLVQGIYNIALLLKPFLPETADIVIQQFTQGVIQKQAALFPRK